MKIWQFAGTALLGACIGLTSGVVYRLYLAHDRAVHPWLSWHTAPRDGKTPIYITSCEMAEDPRNVSLMAWVYGGHHDAANETKYMVPAGETWLEYPFNSPLKNLPPDYVDQAWGRKFKDIPDGSCMLWKPAKQAGKP